ncbi:hypothetical protein PYCC9005_000806 [Savitreella phatthalungensis]
MSLTDPPAYMARPASGYMPDLSDEKKTGHGSKIDVTLYHSEMVGRPDSSPLSVTRESNTGETKDDLVLERTALLPDNISRISVYYNQDTGVQALAVHAVGEETSPVCAIGELHTPKLQRAEFRLNENGTTTPEQPHIARTTLDKLLARAHRHDTEHQAERLSQIAIRVDNPRVDEWVIGAVELSTTRGRCSGWIGRPDPYVGGAALEPAIDVLAGKIVGLRAEWIRCADDRMNKPLTRIACVYAERYADYSGFVANEPQHNNSGASADTNSATPHEKEMTAEERARAQDMAEWKREYPFDTGRWTGNRGVGIRWSHDRRKLEIYQGSNDPNNRH